MATLEEFLYAGTRVSVKSEYSATEFTVKTRSDKEKVFTDSTVKSWVQDTLRFVENEDVNPGVLCVTSDPHDGYARVYVSQLLKQFQAPITFVNTAIRSQVREQSERHSNNLSWYKRREAKILVLYGMVANESNYRYEGARDLINNNPHSPIIVVAGGTNPVDFMNHHIRTPFSAVWFYSSSTANSTTNVIL